MDIDLGGLNFQVTTPNSSAHQVSSFFPPLSINYSTDFSLSFSLPHVTPSLNITPSYSPSVLFL